MKQTYLTPMLVQSGSLVDTTLNGINFGTEVGANLKRPVASNLGFYL